MKTSILALFLTALTAIGAPPILRNQFTTNALPSGGGVTFTPTNSYGIPLIVAYSASTTIDFSGAGDLWIVLGGNLTLASSNLGAGRAVTLRIDNQTATNCSVILPTTWRFVSGTTNNILATSKVGLLSVKSYAANDTNCVALWSSE